MHMYMSQPGERPALRLSLLTRTHGAGARASGEQGASRRAGPGRRLAAAAVWRGAAWCGVACSVAMSVARVSVFAARAAGEPGHTYRWRAASHGAQFRLFIFSLAGVRAGKPAGWPDGQQASGPGR